MPDPSTPPEPSPPPPIMTAGPADASANADPSSTDLPPNVAAAVACIPLIGGIVFYILEKRNSFVRFYAMQSIIFGGAWFFFWIAYTIAYAIFAPIPGIGFVFRALLWAIWAVAGIAFLVIWIIATVKAFSGVRWDIPYVGPMARKQAGEA